MNKDMATMGRLAKFLVFLCLLLVGQSALAQTSGTVTYVYTDPQGTPLAEADASGNITATFDYTPYGSTALGAPPNGPGYTGHVNDPETNLVYMQARYFDPATGRFLSTDPIPYDEGGINGFNRYAYGSNNPIYNTDPTGQQSEGEVEEPAVEFYPKLGSDTESESPFLRLPDESDSRFAARQAIEFAQMCTAPGVKIDYVKIASDAEQSVAAIEPVGRGVIYRVNGQNTSSGLDYIGSTNNLEQRQQEKSDGRDRSSAQVIDTYDKSNKQERRQKEQQAINNSGGVNHLDNRRNEIAPKKWSQNNIQPPRAPPPPPPSGPHPLPQVGSN
ncbi:MAG TPA: RHS repeat-associated core domain-containing protein [Dyella sp.]|uniref:RHS repeat-associated core domain-containing protein n=1 Tax=Dyella sp. TaxID=1869338 RepID=UPI002C2A205F|nr:RHS repeat-associated core domain-containing protein [Dyella sp.]HTV84873.1 RHS repeat-associated core domain-containing protein [Dyella sp.]